MLNETSLAACSGQTCFGSITLCQSGKCTPKHNSLLLAGVMCVCVGVCSCLLMKVITFTVAISYNGVLFFF